MVISWALIKVAISKVTSTSGMELLTHETQSTKINLPSVSVLMISTVLALFMVKYHHSSQLMSNCVLKNCKYKQTFHSKFKLDGTSKPPP